MVEGRFLCVGVSEGWALISSSDLDALFLGVSISLVSTNIISSSLSSLSCVPCVEALSVLGVRRGFVIGLSMCSN